MPVIPAYRPRYTIPGESGNAQQDVGSAGVVGNAIAQFGKTGMAATEDISNILIQRDQKLKAQADTNLAAQKGNDFDNDWLDASVEIKKQYQGNDAAAVMDLTREYFRTARERFAVPDNEKVNAHVQGHLLARENQALTDMASYQSGQLKVAATNVRNYSLETSMKEAQLTPGNVGDAIATYQKLIDAQLANGSISAEEYAIHKREGVSKIREANIESVLASDPVTAMGIYSAVKNDLTTGTQERLEKVLKPSVTRQTALSEATVIYKANPNAPLEKQIDTIKARKDLSPEMIELGIQHLKDQVAVAHADKERDRIQTNTAMYQKVAEANLARKGNGLNKLSDLSSADQSVWSAKDPVAYNAWADGVRRDTDYQLRVKKADEQSDRLLANDIKRERLAEQSSRVTTLLVAGIENADLTAELGSGRISNEQFNVLKSKQAAEEKPYNDQLASILKKIPQVIPAALLLDPKNKNEVQVWVQKYQDLLKTKANNLKGDPNRQEKLTEYFDKYIATEMVTSVFALDSTDRQSKFKEAQKVAGPLPAKGAKPETKTIGGKTYTKTNGKWFEP